jgi:hypothetical protein
MMLISTHCLVQGSSGCDGRAGDDSQVARATPSAERELDEWENALVDRENGMVAAKRALGRARMACDAEHDRVKAVQWDYWVRLRASIAGQ